MSATVNQELRRLHLILRHLDKLPSWSVDWLRRYLNEEYDRQGNPRQQAAP